MVYANLQSDKSYINKMADLISTFSNEYDTQIRNDRKKKKTLNQNRKWFEHEIT